MTQLHIKFQFPAEVDPLKLLIIRKTHSRAYADHHPDIPNKHMISGSLNQHTPPWLDIALLMFMF
jgi:hypothetical protein